MEGPTPPSSVAAAANIGSSAEPAAAGNASVPADNGGEAAARGPIGAFSADRGFAAMGAGAGSSTGADRSFPVPLERAEVDICLKNGRCGIAEAIQNGQLAGSLLHVLPAYAGSDAGRTFPMFERVGRAAFEARLTLVGCEFLRRDATAADMDRALSAYATAPTLFASRVYAEFFETPCAGAAHRPFARLANADTRAATLFAIVGELVCRESHPASDAHEHHKLYYVRKCIGTIAWFIALRTLRARLPYACYAPWERAVLSARPTKLLLAALHATRPDLRLDDVFDRRIDATVDGASISYVATMEARPPLFADAFPRAGWASTSYGPHRSSIEAADGCAFMWLRTLEHAGHFSLPAAIARVHAPPPTQQVAAASPAADFLRVDGPSADGRFVWSFAIHPIYLLKRLIELAARVMEEDLRIDGALVTYDTAPSVSEESRYHGCARPVCAFPWIGLAAEDYETTHAYIFENAAAAAAAELCVRCLAYAETLGTAHCLPQALVAYVVNLRSVEPGIPVDMWDATGVNRSAYFHAFSTAPWPWDCPIEQVLTAVIGAAGRQKQDTTLARPFVFHEATDSLDVRISVRGLPSGTYTQHAPAEWKRHVPKAALAARFLDTLDRHAPGFVISFLTARPTMFQINRP